LTSRVAAGSESVVLVHVLLRDSNPYELCGGVSHARGSLSLDVSIRIQVERHS